MKRLLIVIGLCFAFCLTTFAQQGNDAPATKEDVQRYLDVMHSNEMMRQMLDAMAKPMHQMVHEQYAKDKDKLPPDFEERMNKVMDSMFHDMPFDEMMQAMIPAYQKHLTKGNINDLVVFYSSPTGQKLLRELPSMTADAMQSMMPIMRDYMEKVQDRVQQETAQLLEESTKKSNRPAFKN
jgi:uncharacterized protein